MIILLLLSFIFYSSSFSYYEKSLLNGVYTSIENDLTDISLLLKIETENMNIKESVYTKKQAGFILQKFFKEYGLKKILNEDRISENGSSLLIEKYNGKDKKREKEVTIKFFYYHNKENNKDKIFKLIIQQIE